MGWYPRFGKVCNLEEVNSYYGQIMIGNITNSDALKDAGLMPFGENNIRFVHYPDCQQLIIHLPNYYDNYTSFSISEKLDKRKVFFAQISDIVGGSTQILIDSLFLKPTDYEISINTKEGSAHTIFFSKHEEGFIQEEEPGQQMEEDNKTEGPIVYRDGFGNIIEEEDLKMRDKLWNKMAKIFRTVTFASYGREGEAVYREGTKELRFYMEFGGGDVVFYLNIPDDHVWKSAGFDENEKSEIITYVAEETRDKQASSCNYEIGDREIVYRRNS